MHVAGLAPTVKLLVVLVDVQVGGPLGVCQFELDGEITGCHGVEVPNGVVETGLRF